MQFFLFLALILALILMLFTVQNQASITVTFINWTFEGSLALLLVLSFAAGLMAGIFSSLPAWWRKTKTNHVQKKRIHELEQELVSVTEKKISPQPEQTEEHGHSDFQSF
jgi:uncharacterized integral membrane protein